MSTNPVIDPSNLKGRAGTVYGKATELVLVADIKYDSAFGRPLSEKQLLRILNRHDERLIRPIVLSRRPNGDLVVLDGRTQVKIANDLENESIYALVHEVATPEEEAELSYLLNKSPRNLNDTDAHRQALAWGDPVAHKMEEVLAARGLSGLPERGGYIQAAGTLRAAFGERARLSRRIVLSPAEIDKGAQVLAWVLDVLISRVQNGERPRKVYQRAQLRALIWVRRSAKKFPTAARLSQLWARYTTEDIRKVVLGSEYGITRSENWGRKAAADVNSIAGQALIELW